MLVVAAILIAMVLSLLLARFGFGAKWSRRGERPRVPPAELRGVVVDLLSALGLTVVEEELRGVERRLVVAHRLGIEPVPRLVVFVEPEPPGDRVGAEVVLELAARVRAEGAAVGLLITPYGIDPEVLRAGVGVPLQLIDGPHLRALVARHLPGRVEELGRYRGFGAARGNPSAPFPSS
jgi:hypothetical protein